MARATARLSPLPGVASRAGQPRPPARACPSSPRIIRAQPRPGPDRGLAGAHAATSSVAWLYSGTPAWFYSAVDRVRRAAAAEDCVPARDVEVGEAGLRDRRHARDAA